MLLLLLLKFCDLKLVYCGVGGLVLYDPDRSNNAFASYRVLKRVLFAGIFKLKYEFK